MFAKLLFVAVLCGASLATPQKWAVHDTDTNETCLIVEASPVITVKFTNTSETQVALNTTHSFNGNCAVVRGNVTLQQLTVYFSPNGTPPKATEATYWILDLFFGSNDTIGAFQLVDYSLQTSPQSSIPGSKGERFNKAADATNDVNAKGVNGYKCSNTVLSLENDSSIDMKEFRSIAFAKINGDNFPKGQVFEQCLSDSKTSDIVPIIVGACLAGLVVVVLVAYLIGRARAKRQGYASV